MRQVNSIINESWVNAKQVFTDLYTNYGEKLYEYALIYTGNAAIAEDLCQDVFMKLWTKKDMFCQIDDFPAYLFRMGKNEMIDYSRKKKNHRVAIEYLQLTTTKHLNFTEEFIYQKEMEALLQQAIQLLPPETKKVYLLCKIEGLAYDETAKLLGKSIQTVKNMMRASNQHIREFINSNTNHKKPKKENKPALLSLKLLKAA